MKIHENPKEILGNPVENDGKSTFLDGNAVFFALFELRQEAFRACGASKTPCEAKQKVVMEAPPAPEATGSEMELPALNGTELRDPLVTVDMLWLV